MGVRLLTLVLGLWLALGAVPVHAGIKPNKAYDFYLTEGRICRKCHWRLIGADQVELRRGKVSHIYKRSEVLGVDTHPFLRKVLRHSVYHIWVPGPVIFPEAFEDPGPNRYGDAN